MNESGMCSHDTHFFLGYFRAAADTYGNPWKEAICLSVCVCLAGFMLPWFHCILRRWRESLLLHFIDSSCSSKNCRGEGASFQKQEGPGPLLPVLGFYCSYLGFAVLQKPGALSWAFLGFIVPVGCFMVPRFPVLVE